MPSAKKLIGKTCVYCGRRPATTWDHIFARSFFPKSDGFRNNLPQVPACADCNSAKSEWEGRLINLYQFTGESLSSTAILLSGAVNRNLEFNKALAREMVEGFFKREVRTPFGIYYRESGFELSSESISSISKWNLAIAKAFYYIWTGGSTQNSWEKFVINPARPGMHEFLSNMIAISPKNYTIDNQDCGWSVFGAESDDGVIMFGVEFNSTVQYVIFLKDRYKPVAALLREISY